MRCRGVDIGGVGSGRLPRVRGVVRRRLAGIAVIIGHGDEDATPASRTRRPATRIASHTPATDRHTGGSYRCW
jgi:hypothetical protein